MGDGSPMTAESVFHLLLDAGCLGIIVGILLDSVTRLRRRAWDFTWTTSLSVLHMGVNTSSEFVGFMGYDSSNADAMYLHLVWSRALVIALVLVLPRPAGWSTTVARWAIATSVVAIGLGALSLSFGFDHQAEVLQLARVFSLVAASLAVLGLGVRFLRVRQPRNERG